MRHFVKRMVIRNFAYYQCEEKKTILTLGREPDEAEDSANMFHVIQTKAIVDPTSEILHCPYCHSLMKYLSGFPQGHAQWLCTSCAATAYEGYGDTPSHNTDFKTLNSPNNPYNTEDNFKAIVHDLPSPDPIEDDGQPQHWGRVDINSVDKRRRYGMRFAFMTAEQASRQI